MQHSFLSFFLPVYFGSRAFPATKPKLGAKERHTRKGKKNKLIHTHTES